MNRQTFYLFIGVVSCFDVELWDKKPFLLIYELSEASMKCKYSSAQEDPECCHALHMSVYSIAVGWKSIYTY